ncbi:MAG: thioredoxin [Agarilytica sp.]
MSHIVDVTLENAQSQLIEESFQRPVVIDFWASWCEPCKQLMPVLEKLADEYDGQFLLAKVDSDELQMVASQFGVRSLPTVMVMKDGQPVDGFTGVQPEPQIREILDKYLPKPYELKLKQAQELVSKEQFETAMPVAKEAYELSEKQASAAVLYARIQTKMRRFSEAEALLAEVKLADQDEIFEQVKAELELAQEAQKTPELQALEAQLKAQPEDSDIAFQLAVQYSQNDYHQESLEILFGLISKDLNVKDGEAKKVYLDILAVLGKGDPVAAKYQRKLYTLLY